MDRGARRILDTVWFVLGTVAMVLVMVGVLFLIDRFYTGGNAELIDWQPTRSPEVEARNEIDDVQQMLEAQNEYRRRRGAPELTEDDANRMAREDEDIRERARRSHERRLDELEDEYGV